MITYIAKRLVASLFMILLGATLIFFLIRLGAQNPALIILGENATESSIALLNTRLGLDRPVHEQYLSYIGDLLRGDLSWSWYSREPVVHEIRAVLGNTLVLTVSGMVIAWIVGVTVGVLSAYYRGGIVDNGLRLFALVSVSAPGFVLALASIFIFSLQLRWFPTSGMGTWQHLVLPASSLGLYTAGLLARMTRASMLDVLNQEYITAARARGVSEFWVVMRHAMRNALLTMVTVLGLQFGVLMGGAVITEVVFAWPGMGRIMVQAIFTQDAPTVRGVAVVFLSIFVLINFVVDLLYRLIDPRVKFTA